MFIMFFYILSDHLVCYISRAKRSIPYSPKMLAPKSLFQVRKFILYLPWCSSLYPSHYFTDTQFWWVRNIQMYMILTHCPLYYLNIVAVAYLSYQIPHPFPYYTLHHFISIFSYPNKVYSQIMYCVATFSIFSLVHKPQYTKSLGLKPIAFTSESEQ